MSNVFIDKAKSYSDCHQQAMVRYSHYIGVPLIYFALIIFLGFIRISMPNVFEIDFGWIFSLGLLVYYFKLEWRLALATTPVVFLFNFIASFMSHQGISSTSFWTSLILLIVGAACLLIGHLMMKDKQRSIKDCFSQLVDIPLILMADLFFYFGKFFELHEKIHGSKKH